MHARSGPVPALREIVVALLIGVMTLSGVMMARSFGARAADPLAHAALCLPDEGQPATHDCADCTLGGTTPVPATRIARLERVERRFEPPREAYSRPAGRVAALLPWSRGPPRIA
ncbi:MAG: hypothetical protein LCH38_04070 [Proteobacteria bacterium]|nr:hypothetical protein [Pseudomonadota bacterium]